MQWTTYLTLFLMIAAGSLFIGWDDMQFYNSIKPPVAAFETELPISYEAPYQDALTVRGAAPFSVYDGEREAVLIPRAAYEISGLFIGRNTNFGIRKFNGIFDRISHVDIGIAWGRNADKEFIAKNYSIAMEKDFTEGGRFLYIDSKRGNPEDVYKLEYSNTHVIPADKNILNALMNAQIYDEIQMTGMLVDVEFNGKLIAETSLSRYDEGDGACEIMYVSEVLINNKIYR